MADDNGGNSFLGFILGGVVVVIALFGFLMYSGALPGGKPNSVSIQASKATTGTPADQHSSKTSP